MDDQFGPSSSFGAGWVDAANAVIAISNWLMSLLPVLAAIGGLMGGLAAQWWLSKSVQPWGKIWVRSAISQAVIQLLSAVACGSVTSILLGALSAGLTPEQWAFATLWGAFSPLAYKAGLAFLKVRHPELVQRWGG